MTTMTTTMTMMTTISAPRFPLSTRMRLAAGLVGVVLASGILVYLGLRTVLVSQMEHRIHASLVQEYHEFERFLRLGRDDAGKRVDGNLRNAGVLFLQRSVLDPNEVVIVIDHRRGVAGSLSGALARPLEDDAALTARWRGATEARVQRTRAGDEHIVSLAVPVLREGAREGTFVVARVMSADRRHVEDALRAVAWVTAGAVLLTALAAWWLAGRLTGPLRVMTDTARRITDQDLSLRLHDPGGADEVAVMVRTFNSMLDRLEHALGTQREFLDDAGHELRTPLTVLRGNLDQLRDGTVPPDERDAVIALVDEEVGRMTRIVDDLVALARAQRPDFLRVRPVDLPDLVHAVERRVRMIPGPRWVPLPGAGVVEADPDRITQALLNLAVNAARYSPAGAPVEIGSTIIGGEAVLWVHDSGPGVAPAERERIFRRHERGTERARTGRGLGLAIARAIAEAHGGSLTLADAAGGGGARFELRIPVDIHDDEEEDPT